MPCLSLHPILHSTTLCVSIAADRDPVGAGDQPAHAASQVLFDLSHQTSLSVWSILDQGYIQGLAVMRNFHFTRILVMFLSLNKGPTNGEIKRTP